MNLALLLAVAARLLHDNARVLGATAFRDGRCVCCRQEWGHQPGCEVARLMVESAKCAAELDHMIAAGVIHRVPLIAADPEAPKAHNRREAHRRRKD